MHCRMVSSILPPFHADGEFISESIYHRRKILLHGEQAGDKMPFEVARYEAGNSSTRHQDDTETRQSKPMQILLSESFNTERNCRCRFLIRNSDNNSFVGSH